MNKIIKLGILILIIGISGCKQKGVSVNKQDEKIEIKDIAKDSIHKSKVADKNNHDVFIPEHDYQLDTKIRKAVAHLIDTNLIYEIHQFATHHVVHVLDRKNQTNTGIVYVDKNLEKFNYVTLTEKNPYRCDFPSDTTYLGLPVYDVRGISRKEIEKKLPNVIWDNKGEPTHIYTRSVASNFGATNMVRGYNFSIIGTEGPMAVQSKLYIEDNQGIYLDSIEYIGLEIWHPAITDDGRFVTYYYGRAFPREGGGKVVQHLVVYDMKTRKNILEIKDFLQDGSRIGFGGNFFNFSIRDMEGVNQYFIIDPHKKKIYKIDRKKLYSAGAFKHDGVYAHPHDSPSLRLLSWEDDFEVITFNQYKQK